VFNFDFGASGRTQHISYNASGGVLQTDLTNSDGTHQVTVSAGNQTVSGGSGNDQFVFSTGSTTMVFDHGNDQINNFHAGTASNHDVIQISQSLAANYNHLQIEQVGQDTLVHVNANDSILLTHVNANQIGQGNFLFV
jgi:Ca2+-binding RTX toxin-like protein